MNTKQVTPEEAVEQAKAVARLSIEKDRKSEVIKNFRLDTEYEDTVRRLEIQKKIDSIDLTVTTPGLADELNAEHIALVQALKTKMIFINKALSDITPCYYGNIIVIGAQTGHGKSTASANASLAFVEQKKRVLVLTNEEVKLDVYNRIACLQLNYHYADLENFSEEQHAALALARAALIEYVTVVDAEYKQVENVTTSIEGMKTMLESLILRGAKYDAILIDYYQNVSSSNKNPKKAPHEVLLEFSSFLDDFRKRYKAPIIVFAQLHPKGKKERVVFEDRVKNGKSICVRATFIWEIIPNYEQGSTTWEWHKKRNMKGTEQPTVTTPFRHGRFCEPNYDLLLDGDGEVLQEEEEIESEEPVHD